MLGSEFLISIAPQAPYLPLFWCASESNGRLVHQALLDADSASRARWK